MNARESLREHPWRWFALAVIAVVAIALIAAALFVRALLQPQRFTGLLQSRLANVGLTLGVDKPARPALWPHPAVQLQGFQLTSLGAATPLLTASEARIVVPWRALLRRQLSIERLEIQSPRIDLDQVQSLFSRLPRTSGAPQLPRIDAGIRIADGTLVRNDQPLLFDLDAETGALLPGVPFHLQASAHDSAERAGRLTLRALPRNETDALSLDRVKLDIDIRRTARLALGGAVTWRGGSDLAASLRGSLDDESIAPAASTAAPYPRSYSIVMAVSPARASRPLSAAIRIDGAGEHVDVETSPSELLNWWRGVLAAAPDKPLALPPLRGRAQMDDFVYGPMHLRGVQIESGPTVAPLPAGSTPAPASTAAGQEVAH